MATDAVVPRPQYTPPPLELPSLLGVLVGVGAVAAMAGTLLWIALPALRKHAYAEAHYRTTQGELLDVTGKRTKGEHSDSVEVRYRYDVDGKTYYGDRFCWGIQGSRQIEGVGDLYAVWREHRPIPVHYDPADPSQSVLRLKAHPANRWMVLFAQPFALMAAYLVWLFVSDGLLGPSAVGALYRRDPMLPGRIPGWATAREGPDGLEVRWRINVTFEVVKAYCVVVFAASVVAAVVIYWKDAWTQRAIAVADWTAPASALAWGLFQWPRRVRVLSLDRSPQVVRLKTWRREWAVPFEQIDFWSVRMVLFDRGDVAGKNARYRPLLMLTDVEGGRHPVHLFPEGLCDEAVADAMAWEFARRTEAKVADQREVDPVPPRPDDARAAFQQKRELAKRPAEFSDLA